MTAPPISRRSIIKSGGALGLGVAVTGITSLTAGAATVTTPAGGMVTSGNVHRVVPSLTMPLRITVPTTPPIRTSAWLRLGSLRRRPLILTTLDRPLPWAVAGEKAL